MVKKILKKILNEKLFAYSIVILGYLVIQILLGTGSVSSTLKGQLVPITAYIVMAISLNLTVGILGELSLGHAGFMSIGAFSGVIVSVAIEPLVPFVPLRLGISMFVAAVVSAGAGVLIGVPVLRLKGDYLAIVTLAFGEIIKNLITSIYVGIEGGRLRFHFLGNVQDLRMGEGGKIIVNGPMGIAGINRLSSFTSGVILVLIAIFVVLNMVNSRSGRAIMAVRDNRIAAESVGINVTKYKLIAFTISAMLAGAAGALYGLNSSTIIASKFDYNTSILVLVFVVLGGLGRIWGSIVAATALTVLPEVLREFNDYRMLVYAIFLILIMLATNNPLIRYYLNALKVKLWFFIKRLKRKVVKDGKSNA